jgi:hypothetical protein
MTIHRRRPKSYRVVGALAFVLLAHGGWQRPPVVAAQWNPNQQAVDRCEQDLAFRMNYEARAQDPQANLDYQSLDVRQQSRDSVRVTGRGNFRRDRFDRGRNFTFDCTVDMRSANTRTNYRWSDAWDGNVDPNYPQPPSYRPPYGRGGGQGSYPPTGRVFYSGGIFSRANGKALDVQGASRSDGANVYTWDFVSQPNQLWDVINQGGGRFAIIGQGSGKALDVANRDSADGANVQQYRFSNGDNQLWRIERAGGGYYRIVSVSSGKCLDVDANRLRENGANVQLWTCNGQAQQQWRLGR